MNYGTNITLAYYSAGICPERQLINRMLTGLRYSYELREQRKLDPRRQDLVRRIMADHPEWGPEELQRLHDHLDAWGE